MGTQPRNIRKLLEKQRKYLELARKQRTFDKNQTMSMEVQGRELTFGEKAVGLTFNPGGNQDVNYVKELYAKLIDELNNLRTSAEGAEKKRMYSVAITEAQSSQMWAVKALTWQY